MRPGRSSTAAKCHRLFKQHSTSSTSARRYPSLRCVAALGGGCQTPVGALAVVVDGDALELDAVVAALDGSRLVRGKARAARSDAATLGARVGAQLIADGAGEILAEAASRP